MADYSYQDMLKMQEEAAVRVREMKRRAALAVDDEPSAASVPDQVKHISYPVEIPVNEECKECTGQTEISSEPTFKIDADSVLVLLILVLVSSEESDPVTALALLYLLL